MRVRCPRPPRSGQRVRVRNRVGVGVGVRVGVGLGLRASDQGQGQGVRARRCPRAVRGGRSGLGAARSRDRGCKGRWMMPARSGEVGEVLLHGDPPLVDLQVRVRIRIRVRVRIRFRVS